jgi:hypothetical protein
MLAHSGVDTRDIDQQFSRLPLRGQHRLGVILLFIVLLNR